MRGSRCCTSIAASLTLFTSIVLGAVNHFYSVPSRYVHNVSYCHHECGQKCANIPSSKNFKLKFPCLTFSHCKIYIFESCSDEVMLMSLHLNGIATFLQSIYQCFMNSSNFSLKRKRYVNVHGFPVIHFALSTRKFVKPPLFHETAIPSFIRQREKAEFLKFLTTALISGATVESRCFLCTRTFSSGEQIRNTQEVYEWSN